MRVSVHWTPCRWVRSPGRIALAILATTIGCHDDSPDPRLARFEIGVPGSILPADTVLNGSTHRFESLRTAVGMGPVVVFFVTPESCAGCRDYALEASALRYRWPAMRIAFVAFGSPDDYASGPAQAHFRRADAVFYDAAGTLQGMLPFTEATVLVFNGGVLLIDTRRTHDVLFGDLLRHLDEALTSARCLPVQARSEYTTPRPEVSVCERPQLQQDSR